MTDGPVIAEPAHDQAQLLLAHDHASVASAASPSPADASSSPDAAPRRKGGFPKGGKRGEGGKLIRESGEDDAGRSRAKRRRAAESGRVYDGTQPITGDVKDGPIPEPSSSSSSAIPGAPDPALLEFLRPRVRLGLRAITLVLARVMRKPAAVAQDDELDLMSEAVSVEVATRLPEYAAEAGSGGLAMAVLPYAVRLMELSMSGAQDAPKPSTATNPMAGEPAPAAAPTEANPSPSVALVPHVAPDAMGYGTMPL